MNLKGKVFVVEGRLALNSNFKSFKTHHNIRNYLFIKYFRKQLQISQLKVSKIFLHFPEASLPSKGFDNFLPRYLTLHSRVLCMLENAVNFQKPFTPSSTANYATLKIAFSALNCPNSSTRSRPGKSFEIARARATARHQVTLTFGEFKFQWNSGGFGGFKVSQYSQTVRLRLQF